MARIRTIKPETFTSDDVNALPVPARWTFVGLWCYVDDAGRGRADSRLVKAAVWPIDDAVSATDVEQQLDEMEKRSMICRYTIDGVHYLHVVNFEQHQRINRATASKLPECSRNPHGGLPDPSLRTHGIDEHEYQQVNRLTESSVSPHGALTEDSHPRAHAPEQGTGNREQGTGKTPSASERADEAPGQVLDLFPSPPAPAPTAPATLTITQRSKAITDAYAESQPMCKWPAINGVVIKAIKTERYTDDQIRDALLRLAAERRSVTVETLRIAIEGPPANGNTGGIDWQAAMRRAQAREATTA